MHDKYNSVLDDASAEWYAYHFDDSILQHDVYWRGWHDVIQANLTTTQQSGESCAFCGAPVEPGSQIAEEFVGGFRLVVCANSCMEGSTDDLTDSSVASIQKTIDDVEGSVDG